MLSKTELQKMKGALNAMNESLKLMTQCTLIDFGEEEGFDYLADGLCENLYTAQDKVEDALGAIEELTENMEDFS